jgi:peptidoglycan/xylan/chitin deacetylase (PgdA/CDA1 family)
LRQTKLNPVLPRIVVINLASKTVAIGLFLFTPWTLAGWIFFFGFDPFVLHALFVPSAQGFFPVVTRFDTARREIWLTIDDGPDPDDTPRILALLEKHRAKATFFLIGERARRHPELVRELLRRGHQAGCHTQTHPAGTFWCASPGRVQREIDDCLETLRGCGVCPVWFRAPVGIKNFFLGAVLAARGLGCLGWSVRSCDGIDRDPRRVAQRVLRRLRPGDIVLMHEGSGVNPAVRVTALARVLEELTARRFSCVLPVWDESARFGGSPPAG